MAEINELLELASQEAAALALDATRLRELLSRLAASSTSLEESLEQGLGEAQRLIGALTVRLEEAEEELGRENAAAISSLAGVESTAHDQLSQSQELLSRAQEDLGLLRQERERRASDLEQQADAARGSAIRYAQQAREVHAHAEDRLAQVERSLAALRGRVEETRGAVAERREVLLAEARAFEARLRSDFRHVLQLYDAVASGLEHQLREVQTSAHSLSEQLTARLERKLSQDAVESLSRSAGPLREALDALEQFAARRRDRTASRLSEVTAAIEDVARALERMRPPLDQVKQHLR